MTWVRLEFTIEPFVESGPPPYVTAAVEIADKSGLEVDLGPASTGVEGEIDQVAALLPKLVAAAMAKGATRVSFQVTVAQKKR